jgi:hypothetical protein
VIDQLRSLRGPGRSFCGWRRKASKGLADGLELSRIYESDFLQLVANHVSPISEINPRRQSAAESRRQFDAPTPNVDMWGAASLVRRSRSVSAEVLGEIDCRFLDIQQRLGRSPFGVNHVMAFELDMEELQFVVFTRLIAGDGRAVDQHLRRHQYAIDQQGVSPRHIEIGMGDIGSESEPAARP